MRHTTRYLIGSMLAVGSLAFAGGCRNGSNNASSDSTATAGSYGAMSGQAGGTLPAPAPGDTAAATSGDTARAVVGDTTRNTMGDTTSAGRTGAATTDTGRPVPPKQP